MKALDQRATGLSRLATGTGLLNVTLAVAFDVTNGPDSWPSQALMALGAAPECCGADRVADVMVTTPKTHGPRCGLQTIGRFFEDDHVHMALVVAADRRLVTTIERSDLAAAKPGARCAADLGTLVGRTVAPSTSVAAVRETLLREGRRRLAVVDGSGRLLGLLCVKRDGARFCSDEGIRARAEERLALLRDKAMQADKVNAVGSAALRSCRFVNSVGSQVGAPET